MELKNLYDQRGRVITRMKEFKRKILKENYKFGEKDEKQFRDWNEELDAIDLKVEAIEVLDRAEGIETKADDGFPEFAPGAGGVSGGNGEKKYLTDTSGKKIRIYGNGESLTNSHPKLIDPAKYITALVWGANDELYERAISTSSGQTLKTEFDEQVIDLARKRSAVFAAGAKTIKIDGDSTKFTRLTADGAGAWVQEAGALGDVSPTFDTLSLTSHALLQLVKVSVQSDKDSVNIGEALLQQAVAVFSKELDSKALEGTGTNQPEGVFNYSNVNEVFMGDNNFKFSAYGWEPFLQMQFELNSDNTETTGFILGPRSYRDISLTTATDGQPLQKPPAIANIPFYVTGSSVISDTRTVAPAGAECSTLYAADWTQLWFVSRMDLTTQVLKERYVENWQVGLLFALRGNFMPTRETDFVKTGGVLDESSVIT